MARKLTLGKRIATGIALMLMLMVIVGGAGYMGLLEVLKVNAFLRSIVDLDGAVAAAEKNTDQYRLGVYAGEKEIQDSAFNQVLRHVEEARNRIQKIGERVSDPDSLKKLESSGRELEKYMEAFNRYRQADTEKIRLTQTIGETHQSMVGAMVEGLFQVDKMIIEAKVLMGDMTAYFNRGFAENWSRVEKDLSSAEKSISEWAEVVSSSDELRKLSEKIKAQFLDVRNMVQQHHVLTGQQQDLKKQMDGHKQTVAEVCSEFLKISEKEMQERVRFSNYLILGCILAALFGGTLYAAFSIRRIVGSVKKVIVGITEGTEQVSTAADQVASASQSLAEGSSEQAASLEETSSSLEEMSSVTKQNAARAEEARSLMKEAREIVGKVDRHMTEMAGSIQEITRSSEETGKIIRTIDEIAFQTNLLALNAAVEAARAGSAGAGFAVVADEVRNLARRAAEAAKTTSVLIENTIHAVKSGSTLTVSTQESFRENMEITGKVGQLVEEITAASTEQAMGIEEINRAMAQMNTVTQKTAASAEESAGAAEEMNALAVRMKDGVGVLADLIGKNGKGKSTGKKKGGQERQAAPSEQGTDGRLLLPAA